MRYHDPVKRNVQEIEESFDSLTNAEEEEAIEEILENWANYQCRQVLAMEPHRLYRY